MREKMVSPPSCQHFASGAGKFSQRIQSSASLRTCPLMHLAYMICSFKSGSFGLIPDAAIFAMKNLHQGTVLYLPCSRMVDPSIGSYLTTQAVQGGQTHYSALSYSKSIVRNFFKATRKSSKHLVSLYI